MSLTKQFVSQALTTVPALSKGGVIWVAACDGTASVKLDAGLRSASERAALAAEADKAVRHAASGAGERVDSLTFEFVTGSGDVVDRYPARPGAVPPPAPAAGGHQPLPAGHSPIPGLRQDGSGLPGVKHIVAVGAGKGGVGKSTVALNIAVGLARRGKSVGLLDADIYGPSMPTMLALDGLEPVVREGQLEPFVAHGVRCMTMGALVPAGKPLIWRGPMAHGAFKQLVEQTHWGELDYLVVDLPPGTGDVALSMSQALRLAGAVVVCTPQKVAQDDAVRAARMFQQLSVEVLGVVENMSSFIGDDGKQYDIFGKGGAEHMAQRLGVPFLGAIPTTMSLRENSDTGNPSANFTGTDRPGKELAARLEALVNNLEAQVALATMRSGQTRPTLRVT